ncbi:MAG: hypothetical protein ACLTKI_06180 [Lachnospiraceae bacterium]
MAEPLQPLPTREHTVMLTAVKKNWGELNPEKDIWLNKEYIVYYDGAVESRREYRCFRWDWLAEPVMVDVVPFVFHGDDIPYCAECHQCDRYGCRHQRQNLE